VDAGIAESEIGQSDLPTRPAPARQAGVALEFAGTECVRPEIARRSYESFQRNLQGVNWRGSTLYLNIDPVPKGTDPGAMVQVAEQFFGRVVHRSPPEANFPRAVKWTWAATKGDYLFYLQADWLLARPVNVHEMLAILADPAWDAVNVRRSAGHQTDHTLCLSPVLLRAAVARSLAMQFNMADSPEAQLRTPEFRPGGRGLGVGLHSFHWPASGPAPLVDIGRPWMAEHGYRKAGGTRFVVWERMQK